MRSGAPDRFDPNGHEESESAGYAVLIWSGVAAFALFLAVVAMTYGLPDRNTPEALAVLRSDPLTPRSPVPIDETLPTGSLGQPFDLGPTPIPLDALPTGQGGPMIPANPSSPAPTAGSGSGVGDEEHRDIARLQVENAALRHTVDVMRNRLDLLTQRLQTMEDRFGEFTGSVDRQAVRPAPPAESSMVAATPPAAAIVPPNEDARPRTPYGIELGTYPDLSSLKQGWRQLVADNPDLFARLTGVAGLRERNGQTELLLIAGPFPSATAASSYCEAVETAGRFCLPAFYVGQEIAVR